MPERSPAELILAHQKRLGQVNSLGPRHRRQHPLATISDLGGANGLSIDLALADFIRTKFNHGDSSRGKVIGPFRRRAHFERDYISHVTKLLKQHSREEAMSLAVGGSVGESGFEEIGRAQVEALIGAGLVDGMSVVDLGCGSGRTAVQIARRLPSVQYLGLDVVPALLAHARSICPANYRFVRSAALGFPVPDESVDLVFAYSVFTHLYHEESFAYLRDARRVLRPGGRMIFSFLEFANPDTWYIFDYTVAARKAGNLPHMNTFIERPVVALWAEKLEFRLVGFIGGEQTTTIFEKPK